MDRSAGKTSAHAGRGSRDGLRRETRRVNDKPVIDGEREPSFLSKRARSRRAKRQEI